MISKPVHRIVGFGEAILDYVWRPTLDGGVIVDVRGGGSVFNILANLAQLGWRSSACAVAGRDEAGSYVVSDLAALGVDVSQVFLQPDRRTRLIFESLAPDDSRQVGGMAHAFTTKCPVCHQRIRDRLRPTLAAQPCHDIATEGWAIYDQLTRRRIEHARKARSAGVRTVLDLGAVSYLRYQPTALILAHLREFDLVFLNQRVSKSLANRIGVPVSGLGTLLTDTVIVTTQGPHGAVVTDANGFRQRIAAPIVDRLVDDSGAGDALCSYTLDYLVRHRSSGSLTAATVATAVDHAQEHVIPVLTQVGARGHLRPAPADIHFDKMRGATLAELVEQSLAEQQCALCRLPVPAKTNDLGALSSSSETSPPRSRAVKPGARRNTSLLLNRMLAAAEHPDATRLAAHVLGERGTAHVVGAGGSLPAATYISGLLNSYGSFAAAVTPGDFLASAARADTVIAVSYSGATGDIGQVIRAAKQRRAHRIVLLTAADKPRLAQELRPLSDDLVLSYGPAGRAAGADRAPTVRERGFVSIAGTVAPCIPWLAAAAGVNAVIDLVSSIREGETGAVASAKASAQHALAAARLNVIYGPGALPAALDVESKFTESGLPAVTLHEQKELSHGRFVSVLQPPVYAFDAGFLSITEPAPALFIAAGERSTYQQAVVSALHDAGIPVVEICSTTAELTAPLELLTLVQFFSQTFGTELGIDISRPKMIPEAGLELYRWPGAVQD